MNFGVLGKISCLEWFSGLLVCSWFAFRLIGLGFGFGISRFSDFGGFCYLRFAFVVVELVCDRFLCIWWFWGIFLSGISWVLVTWYFVYVFCLIGWVVGLVFWGWCLLLCCVWLFWGLFVVSILLVCFARALVLLIVLLNWF